MRRGRKLRRWLQPSDAFRSAVDATDELLAELQACHAEGVLIWHGPEAPGRVRGRGDPGRVPPRCHRASDGPSLRRIRDELTGRRDGGRHLGPSAVAARTAGSPARARLAADADGDRRRRRHPRLCRVRFRPARRRRAPGDAVAQCELPRQDDDVLRGDREREALAFAQSLRLALEDRDHDRPVARPAGVDLAELAPEDDPLDGRREPVPAGGDGRATAVSVSGRTEIVTGVPCPGAPGVLRRDQAAQRRPDDHLAAEVARPGSRPGPGAGSSARAAGPRRRRPAGCKAPGPARPGRSGPGPSRPGGRPARGPRRGRRSGPAS